MFAGHRRARIVVAVLAVVPAAATILATWHGPGLTADSINYLSTGLNLAGGRGLRTFNGSVLTVFPPGLPVIVAAGSRLGAGGGITLRVFNAMAFACTVLLSNLLAKRHLRSPAMVLGATALVAVSVPLLSIADRAWTEPAFVLICLAFLLTVEQVNRTRPASIIAAAAALTWIGFLFRYAGVAMIPVGAISILLLRRRIGLRDAMLASVAFAASAALVPSAWMLRNHSVDRTYLGPRNPSNDTIFGTLRRFIDVIGSFLLPDPTPTAVQTLAGVGCIAAVVLVFLMAVRTPRTEVDPRTAPDRCVPLLVFTLVYSAYIIAAQLATAIDALDSRLLSPLFVPTVVLVMVAAEKLADRIGQIYRSAATRIMFTAVAVLLVGQTVGSIRQANAAAHGVGYASSNWQNSALINTVRQVHRDAVIYSNKPWPIWAVLQHEPVIDSPAGVEAWATSDPHQGVRTLWSGCSDIYLAWFEGFDDYHATPETLAEIVRLTPLATVADGTLFEVKPLDGPVPTCPTD